MSVGLEKTSSADHREGYVPIALETLCPTPVLDFDLYISPGDTSGVVLYRERNYPLDGEELAQLSQRGLKTLYIPTDAQNAYRRYLFDGVVKNSGADPKLRYQVLLTVTRTAFDSAFKSISPDNMVKFADEFSTHMVDIVCNDEVQVFDLICLMQHDHYTYTHSVNVCTYVVALANMLWDDSHADLRPIAAGAVMHDIGKRRIPGHVIRKRGALDRQERDLIRQHPVTGFDELCIRQDVTWGGLMTVYQHHERMDGRGYPAGLVGDEIHEWARICAIADVFDAMTTNRSYRKAIQLQDVLEHLESRAGSEFDREMVRCWNSAIKSKS